jgi:membrane protein
MPRKKSTPAAPAASETKATSSPKKRRAQRSKQKSQQSQSIAKKTTKADTTSAPSPSAQPNSSSQAVVDNTSPSQTNGQSPSSTSVTYATARRRPVLEAFIATGAAGMLMYAAMVSFYGALMVGQVNRTPPERVAGWLILMWSVSLVVQGISTLMQLHRTDHYIQRFLALLLVAGNPAALIMSEWLYNLFFVSPGQKGVVWINSTVMLVSTVIAVFGSIYLWYLLLCRKRTTAPRTAPDVPATTYARLMRRRRIGLWLIVTAFVLPALAQFSGTLMLMSGTSRGTTIFTSILSFLGMIHLIFMIAGMILIVPCIVMLIIGMVLVANSQRE